MGYLPSASAAMSDARSAYSRQGSALRGLVGYAGNVAGAAGALQGNGQQLFGQYQSAFAPLVSSLPGMSQMPVQDYVNQAANDVGSNYDRSRGIMTREMARRGVNINSGRFAGLMSNMARNETAVRAGAMTNARVTGQRENFSRGMQAAGLGLNLAQMGQSGLSAAMAGYGQAGGMMSNAAGQYGDMANQAGQYAGTQSVADQLSAIFGGGGDTAAQPAVQPNTATPKAMPTPEAPFYLKALPPSLLPTAKSSVASLSPGLAAGLYGGWGQQWNQNRANLSLLP